MPGKRDRTKRLDEIRIKLISTYKKQLIIFAEILENYNIAKNKFEKNHGEDIFDWPPVSEIRLEILNLKKRKKYFLDQGWKASPDKNLTNKIAMIEAETIKVIFSELKSMQEKRFLDAWDNDGQPLFGDPLIDDREARLDLANHCRQIASV